MMAVEVWKQWVQMVNRSHHRWLNKFLIDMQINILIHVYTTNIDVDHWSTHLLPLLAAGGVEAVGAGGRLFPLALH